MPFYSLWHHLKSAWKKVAVLFFKINHLLYTSMPLRSRETWVGMSSSSFSSSFSVQANPLLILLSPSSEEAFSASSFGCSTLSYPHIPSCVIHIYWTEHIFLHEFFPLQTHGQSVLLRPSKLMEAVQTDGGRQNYWHLITEVNQHWFWFFIKFNLITEVNQHRFWFLHLS